jgi:hypothetical protein
MPKAFRKLCLLSVMASAMVFAFLSAPRSAEATQACLVKHHLCPEEFVDCCCGTRLACVGSIAACQSFCS